jgi:hypothetical protein
MSFGFLDRAEALYRQVADADPRNAIAVVGLARVTLERGDDLGAYLLARRALKIDPDNDAARRLALRIGEVMRTRGDAVPDVGPMPPPGPAAVDAASSAASTPPEPEAPPPGPTIPGRDAPIVPSEPTEPPSRPSLFDRFRRR